MKNVSSPGNELVLEQNQFDMYMKSILRVLKSSLINKYNACFYDVEKFDKRVNFRLLDLIFTKLTRLSESFFYSVRWYLTRASDPCRRSTWSSTMFSSTYSRRGRSNRNSAKRSLEIWLKVLYSHHSHFKNQVFNKSSYQSFSSRPKHRQQECSLPSSRILDKSP